MTWTIAREVFFLFSEARTTLVIILSFVRASVVHFLPSVVSFSVHLSILGFFSKVNLVRETGPLCEATSTRDAKCYALLLFFSLPFFLIYKKPPSEFARATYLFFFSPRNHKSKFVVRSSSIINPSSSN